MAHVLAMLSGDIPADVVDQARWRSAWVVQPASLLQGLEQGGDLVLSRTVGRAREVRAVDALVSVESLGIEITYAPRRLPMPSRRGGAQTWGRHLPGRRHRVGGRPGPLRRPVDERDLLGRSSTDEAIVAAMRGPGLPPSLALLRPAG